MLMGLSLSFFPRHSLWWLQGPLQSSQSLSPAQTSPPQLQVQMSNCPPSLSTWRSQALQRHVRAQFLTLPLQAWSPSGGLIPPSKCLSHLWLGLGSPPSVTATISRLAPSPIQSPSLTVPPLNGSGVYSLQLHQDLPTPGQHPLLLIRKQSAHQSPPCSQPCLNPFSTLWHIWVHWCPAGTLLWPPTALSFPWLTPYLPHLPHLSHLPPDLKPHPPAMWNPPSVPPPRSGCKDVSPRTVWSPQPYPVWPAPSTSYSRF